MDFVPPDFTADPDSLPDPFTQTIANPEDAFDYAEWADPWRQVLEAIGKDSTEDDVPGYENVTPTQEVSTRSTYGSADSVDASV